MCELFAMSSDRPARLTYELSTFSTHGGRQYANRDGWGIVFAQERDAYLYREPGAASASPLETLVAGHSVPSRLVIAHVRRASRGQPALCNTHPFRRTIGGQVCHFAHNGDLAGLKEHCSGTQTQRLCVGDTDSELAFLVLLEQLSKLPPAAPRTERFAVFSEFCALMRTFGSANILYTEGETLFVHAHRRRYEEGGTVSEPRPPGLHLMQLDARAREWRVRGAHLDCEGESHVLLASVPLDDGPWVGLPEGSTLLVHHGELAARIDSP
jgi:predicted glutamine amidotransferase